MFATRFAAAAATTCLNLVRSYFVRTSFNCSAWMRTCTRLWHPSRRFFQISRLQSLSHLNGSFCKYSFKSPKFPWLLAYPLVAQSLHQSKFGEARVVVATRGCSSDVDRIGFVLQEIPKSDYKDSKMEPLPTGAPTATSSSRGKDIS